ncbi:MAG TPA: DsbA family oxidoreductase [Flavobacteriaceae bacterium]|nr:DsbA family oxidoreductase [Flavobacteriaceae bacterium]
MENTLNLNTSTPKMKIEVWSDIMCPFCYIGKRQYETALNKFANSKQVEIEWKSFQLDPSAPEVASESHLDYLVKRKGMSAEKVHEMLASVTEYAKQVGLEYDLYNTVTVNSMKAHQLIQFAKAKGLGDQAEESLFRAFFTENKNVADLTTLTQLGKEIGLDETELQAAFTDDKYAYLVKQDIQEAQQIGVTGVPFFVFNRKYAISGAQPAEVFLETLEKTFAEWQKDSPETN